MGVEDGDGLGRGEVTGKVVDESGAPGCRGCGGSGAGEKDKRMTVAGWREG